MPTSEIQAAVESANRRFEAAVAQQSVNDLVAIYEPNAVLLAPDFDPVVGRDAIADHFTVVFGNGICWIELTSDALRTVRDDVVVEQGRYRVGAGEDAQVDSGAYTVYWVCVGGEWLIHRDIIVTATVDE
ncbi:MAG: nuclear transport factor 2 family protein [Phycisphaerales bacterium]|nr:nuclear transport factor 2 family protein [Phycisphaerales bacterium]